MKSLASRRIVLLVTAATALPLSSAFAQPETDDQAFAHIASDYQIAMNSYQPGKFVSDWLADKIDVWTPLGIHLTSSKEVEPYFVAAGKALGISLDNPDKLYSIEVPSLRDRIVADKDNVFSYGVINEKMGQHMNVSHWMVHLQRMSGGWKVVGGALGFTPRLFTPQERKDFEAAKKTLCQDPDLKKALQHDPCAG